MFNWVSHRLAPEESYGTTASKNQSIRGGKGNHLSVSTFPCSVSLWPKSSPWDNNSLQPAGCVLDHSGEARVPRGPVRSAAAAVAPMAVDMVEADAWSWTLRRGCGDQSWEILWPGL